MKKLIITLVLLMFLLPTILAYEIPLQKGFNSFSIMGDYETKTIQIPVTQGWNDIGMSILEEIKTKDIMFVDMDGKKYKHDKAFNKLKFSMEAVYIDGLPNGGYDYEVPETLQPYNGYWVLAEEDGYIQFKQGTNPDYTMEYDDLRIKVGDELLRINETATYDDGHYVSGIQHSLLYWDNGYKTITTNCGVFPNWCDDNKLRTYTTYYIYNYNMEDATLVI